ncbi:GrpB family protein [Methylogaea oryzae]|nr:GrpB family protein [Methylogaea oryzae]
MPYRRFFAKLENLTAGPLPAVIGDGDDFALGRDYKTSVHIHVMAKDSYHWLRHIAFRDYLLAHPDARADYHRLKQKIAVMDLADPLDYNTHKEAFIREHQDKAMAWRERRRPSAGGVRGTPPRPIG